MAQNNANIGFEKQIWDDIYDYIVSGDISNENS